MIVQNNTAESGCQTAELITVNFEIIELVLLNSDDHPGYRVWKATTMAMIALECTIEGSILTHPAGDCSSTSKKLGNKKT